MPNENDIEPDVRDVLKALAVRKNAIVTGSPGTGKSRLLNQVREFFQWKVGGTGGSLTGKIPVPATTSPIPVWFPSPDQDQDRRVFQTVFDQNTKYRDFMRGLVPKVDQAGTFEVTQGTLYTAARHAQASGNAALVIVDEINRGPAVAVFGSAIVGLDADKRLPTDGVSTDATQPFEILGDDGHLESFTLPNDLYILAAMNEADTSVEPLDVAFLRRFHIHRLEPQAAVLRHHLGLPVQPEALPLTPLHPEDYLEALAQALNAVNDQILIGRGPAYLLGHGAVMFTGVPTDTVAAAQEYISAAWATLRGHIDEVFFGNTRAIADVLRAELTDSPYTVKEETFAGQAVRRITGPNRPTPEELYRLLRLIASG